MTPTHDTTAMQELELRLSFIGQAIRPLPAFAGMDKTIIEAMRVVREHGTAIAALAGQADAGGQEAVAWPAEAKQVANGEQWTAKTQRAVHRMDKAQAQVWNACLAACRFAHRTATPPAAMPVDALRELVASYRRQAAEWSRNENIYVMATANGFTKAADELAALIAATKEAGNG